MGLYGSGRACHRLYHSDGLYLNLSFRLLLTLTLGQRSRHNRRGGGMTRLANRGGWATRLTGDKLTRQDTALVRRVGMGDPFEQECGR